MSDGGFYELRGVSKSYTPSRGLTSRRSTGVLALDDVTLSIAKGERFGIVGESGSGKSTLARIMLGLDQPSSGTVHFDGAVIDPRSREQVRALQSRVQMVFQDPMSSLDPRMRVGDIVLEPIRGLRLGNATAQRAVELLDAVGLPADAAERYPHQFSGGQRQRIAIARALAPGPEVIIADEAVSALDVSVRAQILNLLLELTERLSLTLVFVSHDLSVVRHLTERIAVMKSGRLVELGATGEIYADPQSEYTRALLAAVPQLAYSPKARKTSPRRKAK